MVKWEVVSPNSRYGQWESIYLKKMSCFLRVSCYFQHLKKKKIGVEKKFGGGGGVLKYFIFFRKIILSHFTFYAIVNIKKNTIEKCPFT